MLYCPGIIKEDLSILRIYHETATVEQTKKNRWLQDFMNPGIFIAMSLNISLKAVLLPRSDGIFLASVVQFFPALQPDLFLD